MTTTLTALLAALAAAFAGWMLSGSPVPMALGILVLAAALATKALLRGREHSGGFIHRLLPALVAVAALLVQLRLFQRGEALATRADLPSAYHWGMAALWWATAELLLRPPDRARAMPAPAGLAGALGGLLVLAASAGTVLYDFGPWEAHPVASLPLALWSMRILRPALSLSPTLLFGVLPLALASAGLVLGASFSAEQIRELVHPREDSSLADLGAPPPSLEGNGPLGDAASRQLPREADVRFQNRILVWLKVHSPELFRVWTGAPLYLRASTLALFDSEDTLSPLRSGRWLYDLDDGNEDHTIPLASSGARAGVGEAPEALHTYYLLRESASHLPLVGSARFLLAGSVYEFADGWYQLSPAEGIERLRYTAGAPAVPVAEARSPDLRRPRRDAVPGIYLQMPPSPLSGRIARLCQDLDESDPLGGIRRLLEERTTYSLRFSTPEQSSPLAEFLFGEGRGHCEHYAAATVLMLRSLGIPSRVAYGYAGGLADRAQGLVAFRDSDFHAWAEILTPENEWKVFDTTPRVETAARRRPGPSVLPAVDESDYHDLSEFDSSALAARSRWSDWVSEFVFFVSRHFFLATALSLFLLGGLWHLIGRGGGSGPKRSDESAAPRSGGPALTPFLAELETVAADCGLRRPPGLTWHDLLARMAERGAPPPGASEAIAYHYATVYAGAAPDPEREAVLLAALRSSRKDRPED